MMSGVYDNWERLVDAVLKREQLRQLAYCESLSSSISSDFSSRLSFASVREHTSVDNSATGAVAGGRVAAGAARRFPTRLFTAPAVALARYRRRKPRAEEDSEVYLGRHRQFSLPELQVATDNFSYKNIIGKSVFSNIYKGRLTDGSLVAVKRLKKDRTNRGQQEFQIEVEISSMAVHRNLHCLCGFCVTPTERLLVYPFMMNGSVASCIRGPLESRPPLDWPIRKRIALGSARGLAFLHDHCDHKIIHRDVTAANILLDENFEAVVGGFRFAVLMDHKDTHVTTAVRGAIGHIAPEYVSTGKCSEKTDVFSYGAMLLELISGHSVFHLLRLANDDDFMLMDWVKRLVKEKKLETLVDVDLRGECIDGEVDQLIQLALLCTRSSPMERPNMSEVVKMLESDGLAERWEEQQKEQMFQQDFNHTQLPDTD